MVGMTGFEPATSWSQTKRATSCATCRDYKKKWALRDSNSRQPGCKPGALPTELNARFVKRLS